MRIAELTVPEDKRIGTVTKSVSAIYPSGTQTIRNLARVSRRMNAIANKIMYRSIVIADSETGILLLQSLLLFPHNRNLVQHLEVRPPAREIGLGPPLAEPSRFFNFNEVLQTIYESESQHPQLPRGLLRVLRQDLRNLTPQETWETGRYPRGGFNMVTAIISYICNSLISFKIRTMGEWSGSTCTLTKAPPGILLHSCIQHLVTFGHLHILNLDVSVAYDVSHVSFCLGCRWKCPPNIRELTLRHEDASLSRNFVHNILNSHWRSFGTFLFENRFFFVHCYPSLRKLRLLGGFDHAGLSDPSNLFSLQTSVLSLSDWNTNLAGNDLGDFDLAGLPDPSNLFTLSFPPKAGWNDILPLFQQLTHLEFAGYGDPCPPDDRHRMTWPDNRYRYGPKKTFSCLAKLPNLQYLKLPLLDLFPSAFPDTHEALRQLLYPDAVDGFVPNYGAPYHCRLPRLMMIEAAESLASSLDTGLGIRHNIEQKLREAAGGPRGEIPRDLERVDLYYYVRDTDLIKDPRERWAKSGQYAHLSRQEIERLERKLWREGGWFPTKEVVLTWRRNY
ncbi:hypothetical protein B0T20DRAFT_397883 [Sordaria brevicollis]|uniref:Uncharacterized protein n=1 Tax=Sordaria brevicollis TaxID=83679 RepID=A0AAE0NVH4_SORBR|nr:hypothetical protein B0T20DRAFT_397883 [Sordaria brevicollis]